MGRISGFVIKQWKLLLNIITVIALLIAIYVIRDDLVATFRNLFHVHAWVLLMFIPLEALNYHAQTKLYQHLFAVVGNKLPYKKLYVASLELAFVNHVFPSGGAAGISYFGLRFKDVDISAAKSTMIQIMKVILTFFSFEALIFLSVIFLAIGGKVNSFTMLVAGIISTLLIVISILFVFIAGKRERINAFLAFMTEKLNKFLRMFRKSPEDYIDMEHARVVFDEFHDTYMKMHKNKKQIQPPLLYALLCNVTEIAVVYVTFIAFGYVVNPGAVILAYGVANIAGMISILPGGVGIYETLMTAVLLTTGISADLSLPVIIMYRVLNTLLQMPTGYFLYQRNIYGHGKSQHKPSAV